MSRCIWALTDNDLVSRMTVNAEPNARLWLFELSDELDQASFTRMVATLWSIWYARRKAVYESLFRSPQQTIRFVDNFLSELGQLESGQGRREERAPPPAQPKR